MEHPKTYKRRARTTKKGIFLFATTTMITSTPSPTITAVKLMAVEIIKAAITNHLNLRTPPSSPQPTILLPVFPLTIAIPSPQDLAVHIDNQDPSPFTLRQPLPDSTLDLPINYNRMDEDKENDDPNVRLSMSPGCSQVLVG